MTHEINPEGQRPSLSATFNGGQYWLDIYNADLIAMPSGTEWQSVYSQRSIERNAAEQVELMTWARTIEGQDELAMHLCIDVKCYQADKKIMGLKQKLLDASNSGRYPYEVSETEREDVVRVKADSGLTVLASFDLGGNKIELGNHLTFPTPHEGSEDAALTVTPKPLAELASEVQLRDMGMLMGDIVDYLSFIPDNVSSNMHYEIGKDVVHPRAAIAAPLGELAVAGKNNDEAEGIRRTLGIELLSPGEVGLDDIVGNPQIKDAFGNLVDSYGPERTSILQKRGAQRPQRFLLHGDTGTGKTMAVRALANGLGARTWNVTHADIYDGYQETAVQKMTDLFTAFEALTEPTVILFDGGGILGLNNRQGISGMDELRNRVTSRFMEGMKTLTEKCPNTIIAVIADNPEAYSELLRHRFDLTLSTASPNATERSKLFGTHLLSIVDATKMSLADVVDPSVDLERLAAAAEGQTGADIARIVNHANYRKVSTGPLTQDDLMIAIREARH